MKCVRRTRRSPLVRHGLPPPAPSVRQSLPCVLRSPPRAPPCAPAPRLSLSLLSYPLLSSVRVHSYGYGDTLIGAKQWLYSPPHTNEVKSPALLPCSVLSCPPCARGPGAGLSPGVCVGYGNGYGGTLIGSSVRKDGLLSHEEKFNKECVRECDRARALFEEKARPLLERLHTDFNCRQCLV